MNEAAQWIAIIFLAVGTAWMLVDLYWEQP